RLLPRQLLPDRARGPPARRRDAPRASGEPAARRPRRGVARAASDDAQEARLAGRRRRAGEALMAPVLIAILSLTVLGIPFVLAVDRDAPPLRLLGLACLYGTGVIYFVLLALSVLHLRWTLIGVTIAAIVVTLPFIKSLGAQHSALNTRLHV